MEIRNPTKKDIINCMNEIYFLGNMPINNKDQRIKLVDDTRDIFLQQNMNIPQEMHAKYVVDLLHDREFCNEAGLEYETAPNHQLDVIAGISYYFRLQMLGDYPEYLFSQMATEYKDRDSKPFSIRKS